MIDFTPELRADAIETIDQYVHGPIFTPPSLSGDGPGATKGSIQLPGSVGGTDWNGAAFDPDTGIIYIPSVTSPIIAAICAPFAA